MRVLVNGLATGAPRHGIGRTTLGILRALARRDPESEFVVLAPADGPPLPVDAPNVLRVDAPWSLDRPLKSLLFEQAPLPDELVGVPFDVQYSPSFLLPDFAGTPSVVTVHDLGWRLVPDQENGLFRGYVNRRLGAVLKSAARVICVSEHGRADLERHHEAAVDGRLAVVPHGVDLDRFQAAGAPSHEMTYVAVVGEQERRGTVGTLADAFPTFRARMRPCRVAGKDGLGAHPSKPAALDIVGRPEDDELAALFQRALMVVQPTQYEGFGLPVLEAMACGTPVACADTPGFREIAAEAAVFFDPRDPASISRTMSELARDKELRTGLVTKGRARAAHYGRDKTADRLLALFREVAS